MTEPFYIHLLSPIINSVVRRHPNILALDSISARVDDSGGWSNLDTAPNERPWSEIQDLYSDALLAWRKNPLAKRIVDITTDFVVGDGISLDGPGSIGRFIDAWWCHPKNQMDLRLPDLSDELTRAGDLFITLHRNDQDGQSYIRAIPKDRIQRILTAPNDWETELAFYETQDSGEPREWLSPAHPRAPETAAIMIHYAINRPVGALLGESDLATLLTWLRRYSQMLEDRVRLNWAIRLFMWMVNVPTNKLKAKIEQYRTPPESGSVLVTDGSETWTPVAPLLRANDASYDLRSVRRMIQSGSFPPHWLNDPEDINRATADAMNDPAVRFLRRRQRYIRFLLIDLAHIAYTRAWQIGKVRAKPDRKVIKANLPDISREDNASLAVAARNLSQTFATLQQQLGAAKSMPIFTQWMLALVSRFAGEPLTEEQIRGMIREASDKQAG